MSCNVKMCVRHTRDLHVRFQLNQYRMLFHTMCVCTFRFNLKFTFPSARLPVFVLIWPFQLINLFIYIVLHMLLNHIYSHRMRDHSTKNAGRYHVVFFSSSFLHFVLYYIL